MMRGVDMADEQSLTKLSKDVAAAQKELAKTARTRPNEWWDARELRREARNGWAGGVMSFALTDLVNGGSFELNPHLKVRPKSE